MSITNGLSETEKVYIVKSVKTSVPRFSIINGRGFDTFSQILLPLSLVQSAHKEKNREICDISAFDFFKL